MVNLLNEYVEVGKTKSDCIIISQKHQVLMTHYSQLTAEND